jgi:Protein of unknown function (DUF4087)
MKKSLIIALGFLSALSLSASAEAENRCGWIQNPTPGNWWLTDAQGDWTIMTQGSYEAEGMDQIGDISAGDYIATNGNYGYGCACMDVESDGQGTITRINSFRQLRLAKCERDSALPAPN